MKLSIITINRNNAIGLGKTIRSVLAQSYQGFEYIIVDGNSDDDSVSVIKDELEGHSQNNEIVINWISEPDSGIYNAMNKGIGMSHGDYLLFLNSGDFLVETDVLEKVFSKDYDEDLLCARCNVSENDKVVWTSPLVPETITLGWLYFNGLMHQSTFIRRDLFYRIGMYDESFVWLADIQFWYKAIIYRDATTKPIDVVTSNYNHEGASSVIRNNPRFDEEASWAFSQPILKHIMPDYQKWNEEKRFYREFGWIEKRKTLKKMLWYYKKVEKKAKRER